VESGARRARTSARWMRGRGIRKKVVIIHVVDCSRRRSKSMVLGGSNAFARNLRRSDGVNTFKGRDDSQRARDSSGKIETHRSRRNRVSVFLTLNLAPTVAGASDYKYGAPANGFSTSTSCPWVAQSRHRGISDVALANEVIRRMTLAERVSFVVLSTYSIGEPERWCAVTVYSAALTLRRTHGSREWTHRRHGVSAELDSRRASTLRSCATWAKRLATRPRTKGITVMQGPELNLLREPLDGRGFEPTAKIPSSRACSAWPTCKASSRPVSWPKRSTSARTPKRRPELV